MPTAHIVHGFNVSDSGKGTTDKFREPLEKLGYTVREWDYGYKFLLGTWYINPRIAAKIAAEVQPGDIGVGHSNGAAILYRASQIARFDGMVLINPALDKDKAPECNFFHVYYHPKDDPVWWGSKIPWVYWGEMGRTGYIGDHPGYTGFNEMTSLGLPMIKDNYHSEFFKYDQWIDHAAYKALKAQDVATS